MVIISQYMHTSDHYVVPLKQIQCDVSIISQWNINNNVPKSLQSRPTLCDPIDGSPPGSPVPGILQARTLEWVAISFSNACKWKVKVKSLSHVWLFATPWTAAYQAPAPKGFSRQEYCSGLPLPSPMLYIIPPNYLSYNTKFVPLDQHLLIPLSPVPDTHCSIIYCYD